MKILISAYACEPNRGSEPGVGWGWAVELTKKNEVWIITRDNNKSIIDNYLLEHPEYKNANMHFEYVGVSKKMTFWKKGNRGIRLYYLMWQRNAYLAARKLCTKVKFDYVQHVTFVSYTQPTYMYKLGLPLIWGPVAGGDNIPSLVKIQMTTKERTAELVRGVLQRLSLLTPSIRKTMKHAQLILAATQETKSQFPTKYQKKIRIMPAIGLEKMPNIECVTRNDSKVKIVMAGRLIYLKAIDVGMEAFMQIADQYPEAELHILGEGDRKESLMRIAGDYLNKQIFFDPPVAHDDIYAYYAGFDIFMNTSLRDSGCMTMMEAMCVGLPSIAIATGGPGVLLEEFPEAQIAPSDNDELIMELSERLGYYIAHKEKRQRLGNSQREYIQREMSYASKCKWIENNIIRRKQKKDESKIGDKLSASNSNITNLPQ